MTERSDWYKMIVDAARKRDHAIKMVANWQAKLADAEQAIKVLSTQTTTQNTEQE